MRVVSLAARFAGLDADIVPSLPARAKVGCFLHVLSCGVACVAGATGFASGAWLVGAGPFAFTSATVFGALMLWNLLRLLYAGSGLAPATTDDQARRWRASLAPAPIFLAVGVAMAQPLLALASAPLLAGEVGAYRARLVEMHERAILRPLEDELRVVRGERAELEAEFAAIESHGPRSPDGAPRSGPALPVNAHVQTLRRSLAAARAMVARDEARVADVKLHDVEPYAANAASLPLPLFRVRSAWRAPVLSGMGTLVFVLLVASPLVLRCAAPETIRPYELERRRRMRASILKLDARARRQRESALVLSLTQWPARSSPLLKPSGTRSGFADPPFNQVPILTDEERADLRARALRRRWAPFRPNQIST